MQAARLTDDAWKVEGGYDPDRAAIDFIARGQRVAAENPPGSSPWMPPKAGAVGDPCPGRDRQGNPWESRRHGLRNAEIMRPGERIAVKS